MNNRYLSVICVLLAIIALPVGYYYGYALPKNNSEALELQRLELEQENLRVIEDRAREDIEIEDKKLQTLRDECNKEHDEITDNWVKLINDLCTSGGGDMECVKRITKQFWPNSSNDTQSESPQTYVPRCVERKQQEM